MKNIRLKIFKQFILCLSFMWMCWLNATPVYLHTYRSITEFRNEKKQLCGTPKVQIDWSGEDSLCSGSEIVLKTQWANAGASPSFVWKKGNEIVGNEPTYTTTVPVNDKITVIIKSDETCADINTDTDEIDLRDIKIIENIHPSVQIADSITEAICYRDTISFVAKAQDFGIHPIYIWKVDGYTKQEGESDTFQYANFLNGQIVSVELNTIEGCSVKGKNIAQRKPIKVKEQKTPHVEVVSNIHSVCEDSIVEFKVNSDIVPNYYQWRVGGKDSIGANESTWKATLPVGEYVVSVLLKFNDHCVSPEVMIKETQLKVLARNSPSIKIKELSQTTMCAGTPIEIETYERKYRGNVSYTWFVNDIVQADQTQWFANFTPPAGATTIKVVMKTDYACSQPDTATSTIMISVKDTIKPTVKIQEFDNPICPLSPLELYAIAQGEGDAPVYQWTIGNTTYPETNESKFSTQSFNTGDVISVKVTSSDECARPKSAIDYSQQIILDTVRELNVIIDNFIEPICSQNIELKAKLKEDNFSEAIESYQWFINEDSIIGDTTYSFIPTDIKSNDVVSIAISLKDGYCIQPKIIKNSVKYTAIKPDSIPSEILCDCVDSILINDSSQMRVLPFHEIGMWSSSNESVATIDSITGKIIAKQPGHVIISFIDTNYCQPLVKNIHIYMADSNDATVPPKEKEDDKNKPDDNKDLNNGDKPTIWETHPNNTDKNDSLFIIPNFLIADGNNSFEISNLEAYPNSSLKIYNKWGGIVYETDDYKNDWKGTFNGDLLPTATYYYILNRNKETIYSVFKGFIHLAH